MGSLNFCLKNSDPAMPGAFKEQYYLGQRVLISPEFIARQGCKKGYLKVTTADATLTSPQQTFCAKPRHSAKNQADAQFRCQQFIAISLKPGFSRADLTRHLASLDAQIRWYQAEIELYFIEPNEAASSKAWESLVGYLKGQDFIRSIKQYDQQTQSYIDQHFKL